MEGKRMLSDPDVAPLLMDARVLVRVNFDVPLDKANPNVILDTERISKAMPILQYILDKGAKAVILCSHLSRPSGQRVSALSLVPVAKCLAAIAGKAVTFLPDCCGSEVEAACANPKPGSIILLENLRFNIAEEGQGVDAAGNKVKAKPESVARFRASLARLADVYVNDTFGTSHRSHSSMLGKGFGHRICGFLVQKELTACQRVLNNPKRPVLAILGGMKLSDKIQVIMHMLDHVDMMIIGGGMAFTILKVTEGIAIGHSIYDKEGAGMALDIVVKAKKNGVELALPVDFTISSTFGEDGEVRSVTKRV
jgi:phosphoglycerate kinase